MSKLTARQYAAALHKSLSETGESDQDRILDRFVEVLRVERALDLLDEIEHELYRYERESKGIKLAEVTSARKLSEDEEKEIIAELNDYVKGEVELQKKVDEGLMGGVVVKLDDELIDGSVKKQLKNLKDKLIR